MEDNAVKDAIAVYDQQDPSVKAMYPKHMVTSSWNEKSSIFSVQKIDDVIYHTRYEIAWAELPGGIAEVSVSFNYNDLC